MRQALVNRLARRLDGEALALLGTVGTALTAIDRAACDDGAAACRLAVAEAPNIAVIFFDDAGEPRAAAALDPREAIAIAAELIAVALPALAPAPPMAQDSRRR